jgi:cytochrome bd-type quinol oxidase subunit 2
MSGVGAGLTHFQALTFFALVVSAVFAFLSKRGARERAKYFAWAFLLFLLVAVGIGWLMYPLSQ